MINPLKYTALIIKILAKKKSLFTQINPIIPVSNAASTYNQINGTVVEK